ncbi:MAG: hypothetical protein IKH75_14210 [Ruminococcus sp.]|nr:hypothetical protein [Ruminococcus sp.]
MTYYKVYTTGNSIDNFKNIFESYSRKEAFQKAQELADRTGTEIGIQAERGTWLRFYRVVPRE